MSSQSHTRYEVEDARKFLLKYLKPGDTVYLVLESESRSGMSRAIIPYAFYLDHVSHCPQFLSGELWAPVPASCDCSAKIAEQYLGGWACKLLGLRRSKRDGVIMEGAGMDLGFDLVYELAVKLFGTGDALKHRWL